MRGRGVDSLWVRCAGIDSPQMNWADVYRTPGRVGRCRQPSGKVDWCRQCTGEVTTSSPVSFSHPMSVDTTHQVNQVLKDGPGWLGPSRSQCLGKSVLTGGFWNF